MEKEQRRAIVKSDIDQHGNVVLWDHGPSEPRPDVDRDSEEFKRLEAEAEAWHRKHKGPVPLTMDHAGARHALEVEPLRYALEPDDASESEVETEIEKIRQQRADAEKVSADRAEAAQLVVDRKAAIAIVAARHREAPDGRFFPEPEVV